ncbi:MAG: hypothetical protein P1U34_08550 [Coxiellaceae bacterium]|nr:hypothetical protein [Coxiellaceae bacterium]
MTRRRIDDSDYDGCKPKRKKSRSKRGRSGLELNSYNLALLKGKNADLMVEVKRLQARAMQLCVALRIAPESCILDVDLKNMALRVEGKQYAESLIRPGMTAFQKRYRRIKGTLFGEKKINEFLLTKASKLDRYIAGLVHRMSPTAPIAAASFSPVPEGKSVVMQFQPGLFHTVFHQRTIRSNFDEAPEAVCPADKAPGAKV